MVGPVFHKGNARAMLPQLKGGYHDQLRRDPLHKLDLLNLAIVFSLVKVAKNAFFFT